MVKSAHATTNIFNLTGPEKYRCQLLHYHNRLSRLYLAIYKGNDRGAAPVFYVLFSDVGYMECPVSWQNAQFDVAPAKDCIALMLDRGLIGQAILQFPNAYGSITEHARLYIGHTTSEYPVRIIANSANRLHQLPDRLL